MGAIARGSERELARLYGRYSRLLYSLILAILRNPEDAEEVLQEVFVQVWRRAGEFKAERGSVYGWLVTLARSRAIDHTRGRGYTRHRETEADAERLAEELETTLPNQLDVCLAEERAGTVRRVVEGMPPDQRDVLRLAYFQGRTQREIARDLGLPLGTVKTRTRQALIRLQSALAQEGTP